MRLQGRHWAALLNKAARAYADDRAIRLGAGLAYYSLFALVPIMSLAVSLATIFFGQEALISFTTAVSELLGDDAATALTLAIEGTEGATFWLSVTSLTVLLLPADSFLPPGGTSLRSSGVTPRIGVSPQPSGTGSSQSPQSSDRVCCSR